MKQEKGTTLTPENILVGATALAGTAAEIAFMGHNPSLELPLMWAVATVQGIPVTPMLQVVRQGLREIIAGE